MRTKGKLHSEYGSIRTETGIVIAWDASTVNNLWKGDVEHLVACWNAIESIGGDPEIVGTTYEALKKIASDEGGDFEIGVALNTIHNMRKIARDVLINTIKGITP